MELVGSALCVFRRAIQILLNEYMCEYRIHEDILKLGCPILKRDETELVGFIAATESLLHFDHSRTKDRMWIFLLITDFFPPCKDIILHRITQHKVSNLELPSTEQIRHARQKLRTHLTDLDRFFKENNYLGGRFLAADSLFTAILSFLDYSNEIQWENYRHLSYYYSAIKARPSFHFILEVKFAGLAPSRHYRKIDFMDEVAIS
jgi:hypothetical protein